MRTRIFGCLVVFAATAGAQSASVVTNLPTAFVRSPNFLRQTGSRIDSVSGGAKTIAIGLNQLMAVHAGTAPVFVRGAESTGSSRQLAYALPTRYLARSVDAPTALTLRPVYMAETDLTYVPDSQRFRGSFLIGVEDTTAPSASENLSRTIAFQFVGGTEQLNPASVDVGHTNLPLASVSVTAASPVDSVRIHIIPQLDPVGVDVWLHVTPTLKFLQLPGAVQGLGIENATVVVGAAGTSLREAAVATVTTTNGFVDPQQVTLGNAGTATTHLRSRGIGAVMVSVSAPGFAPVSGTVQFVFPWAFVIAALCGGAAGVAVKGKSGSALASAVVRGALAGTVVALVYFAIRVSLIAISVDIQYFNEVAVFALAFLGGWLGIRQPAQ